MNNHAVVPFHTLRFAAFALAVALSFHLLAAVAGAAGAVPLGPGTPPVPTIAAVASPNYRTLYFGVAVTFDEPVTDLQLGDFVGSGINVSNLTGSGDSYTIDLAVTGADGIKTLQLPAGTVIDGDTEANVDSNLFTLVLDRVAPTATIGLIASPTNQTFFPGVTVTFSEPVTGLALGDFVAAGITASNLLGTGANYTVDLTLDPGDGLKTIRIPTGAVIDLATNSSLASNTLFITLDQTPPEPVIAAVASPTSNVFIAGVAITFAESVAGLDLTDFVTSGVTVSNLLGSGDSYTVDLTLTGGDGVKTVELPPGAVTDLVGNPSLPSNQLVIVLDVGPIPTIAAVASPNYRTLYFGVTVTFNEPVTGLTAGDFLGSGIAVSNLVGSGDSYTIDLVLSGADGPKTLQLPAGAAAHDPSGTLSMDSNVLTIVLDRVAPTVAIGTVASPTSIAFFAGVPVTFSEAITGLDASDFVTVGITVSNLQGGGANYTIDLTLTGADGVKSVRLPTGAVIDLATNSSVASNTVSITLDQSGPTPTIAAVPSPTNQTTFTGVSVSFTEPVTGLLASDFVTTGGITITNLVGAGANYLIDLELTGGDGFKSIQLPGATVVDAFGNPNVASNIVTIQLGTLRPGATIAAAPSPTNVTFFPGVAVTFTAPVTGLALSDFATSGITVSNLAGGGDSYTVDLTLTGGDGVKTVQVAAGSAVDVFGNTNTASNLMSITLDTVGAVPTISAVPSPTNLTTIVNVTVVFDEPVTGLAVGDFLTSDITVSNLQGSGANYTMDLTLTGGDGVKTVQLAPGVVDLAGNPSVASNILSITLDSSIISLTNIVSLNRLDPEVTGLTQVAYAASFDGLINPATLLPGSFQLSGLPAPVVTSVSAPMGQEYRVLRSVGPSTGVCDWAVGTRPDTAVTVEAWVWVEDFTAQPIVLDHELATTGGYRLWFNAAGDLIFGVNDGVVREATAAGLLTHRWYHVAGAYDGATVTVWVNGRESAATAAAATTLLASGDTVISPAAQPFVGGLAEFRLWSSARSLAELRANARVPIAGPYPADLVLYPDLASPLAVAPDRNPANNSLAWSGAPEVAGWFIVDVSTAGDTGTLAIEVVIGTPIQDAVGAGLANGIVGETYTIIAPLVPTFDPIAPVQTAGVAGVILRFDQPAFNVDVSDFTLTRDAGPDLLPDTMTVTTLDNLEYQISGLATLTEAPGTYVLTVWPSDIETATGLAFNTPVSLTWRRNDPPTAIGFADVTVPENEPPFIVNLHGGFADSEDLPSDMVYTVEGTTNGDRIASTVIDSIAGELEITLAPNRSGTVVFTLRATDTDGEWVETTLTLIIQVVNRAPSDIALTPSSIAEFAPLATAVGQLTTVDTNNPDAGQTHTYMIVTPNSPFQLVGDELRVTGLLDSTLTPTVTVRVRTTDNGSPSLWYEENLVVTVLPGNKPPTQILISYDGILEGAPDGTVVGTLTSVDPNAGDSHTYEIVFDETGGGFGIQGDMLVLADRSKVDRELDRELDVYIRSTDNGLPFNLSYIQTFTIHVNDNLDEPTLGRNLPLWVLRGERGVYNSSRLQILDDDHEPEQRYFLVRTTPTLGDLIYDDGTNSRVLAINDTFSQAHVNAGFISYQHTALASAILVDEFTFWFTDFTTQYLGPVTAEVFITLDNTPPHLATNNTLSTFIYTPTTITTANLEITDAEQVREDLSFIVQQLPTYGRLFRDGREIEDVGDFFTQQQIDDGEVQYMPDQFGGGSDQIIFEYTDNIEAGPAPQYFFMSITTPTNTAPYLDATATLQAPCVINSSVLITNDMLRVLDVEQPPALLSYRVITPPQFGFLNLAVETKAPLGPADIFTQLEVNQGHLSYVSTGLTTLVDTFTLEFEDSIGTAVGPITFTIVYNTAMSDWTEYH